MDFQTCLTILFPMVKEYTYFSFYIRKDLGKSEVIGINANSPSVARKSDIIERIKEAILSKQLPIEVIDEQPETTRFKLKIKS